MHIIETRTAPNPRRVRMFLAEKGIEVAFVEMALSEEALRSAPFTALNPMQRVPVLVLDDGTAITESVAICRYFEELQPEPALFGRGALERARVEMWNRRAELGLFAAVTHVFRHLHPKMAALEVPQVAAWGEANKAKVVPLLEMFDAALAHHEFVAGDTYSIADITLLVAVDFMRPARIKRPESLTNLARWHAQVSARASAAA